MNISGIGHVCRSVASNQIKWQTHEPRKVVVPCVIACFDSYSRQLQCKQNFITLRTVNVKYSPPHIGRRRTPRVAIHQSNNKLTSNEKQRAALVPERMRRDAMQKCSRPRPMLAGSNFCLISSAKLMKCSLETCIHPQACILNPTYPVFLWQDDKGMIQGNNMARNRINVPTFTQICSWQFSGRFSGVFFVFQCHWFHSL